MRKTLAMTRLVQVVLILALIAVTAPAEASLAVRSSAVRSSAVRSSSVATRLLAEPTAIARDLEGRIVAAFELPMREARIVFLPVTRTRPLPAGYEPPDLTRRLGRPVREVVVADLLKMKEAAATDGVELAVVSGYRSPVEQSTAFESSVWRAIGRSGGTIDRAEAEARAGRFVAPPGHSQHQLGTAIDFSTWEIDYAVQPAFDETTSSRWLAANAWAYGFVLPYPRDGEERTGYAYEPWHWRWLGRPLGAALWRDGYLGHPTLVVDDYLRAVEEVLDAEAPP